MNESDCVTITFSADAEPLTTEETPWVECQLDTLPLSLVNDMKIAFGDYPDNQVVRIYVMPYMTVPEADFHD
jgi:hypothetical protein